MTAEHKAALEELYQEHVRQKKSRSDAELAVRLEELRRENNRALSEAQLKSRRELAVRSSELKDDIFAEVEKKLEEFRRSPSYLDYICDKISKALRLAGNKESDIIVYMDPADAETAKEASSRCGIRINDSEEPLLGGVRAVIPSRKLLFDYAFLDLLNEEKEAFSFKKGGLKA